MAAKETLSSSMETPLEPAVPVSTQIKMVTNPDQLPAPPPGFQWARLDDVMRRGSMDKIQRANSMPSTRGSQNLGDEALIELTLSISVEEVADREKLKSDLIRDIADSAAINIATITVLGFRGGSVVDISIKQGLRDSQSRNVADIIRDLEDQSKKPSSKLMKGQITSKIVALRIREKSTGNGSQDTSSSLAAVDSKPQGMKADVPDITELQKSFNLLQAAAIQDQRRLSMLQSENDELRKEREGFSERLEKAASLAESMERRAASMKSSMEYALDQANAAVEKLRLDVDSLTQDNRHQARLVQDLSRDLAAAQGEVKQQEARIQSLQDSRDQATSAGERLKEDIEGITAISRRHEARADQLQLDLARVKGEAETLAAANTQLKQSRDQALAKVGRLESEVEALESAGRQSERLIHDLHLEIGRHKSEAEAHAATGAHLAQSADLASNTMVRLEREVEALAGAKLQLQREVEDFRRAAGRAQTQLEEQSAAAAALAASLASEQDAASKLRGELETSREETRKLELQLDDLRLQLGKATRHGAAHDIAADQLATALIQSLSSGEQLYGIMEAAAAAKRKGDMIIDDLQHQLARLKKQSELHAAHAAELALSCNLSNATAGKLESELRDVTIVKLKQDSLIQDLQRDLVRLKGEGEDQLTKIAALTYARDEANEQAGKLQKQLDTLTSYKLLTDDRIENFLADLEKARAEAAQKGAALEAANQKVENLEKEIEDMSVVKSELAVKLEASHLLAERLKKEGEELSTEKADLLVKFAALQTEAEGLKKEGEELSNGKADLLVKFAALQTEADRLKKEGGELSTDKADLLVKLAALQTEADRLKKEGEGLSTDKADLLVKLAALETEVSSLTADRQTQQTIITDLNRTLAELKGRIDDHVTTIATLTVDRDTARTTVSELSEDKKQLTQSRDQSLAEGERLRGEITTLRGDITKLEGEISVLRGDKESLIKSLEESKGVSAMLTADKDGQARALSELEESLTRLRAQTEADTSHIKLLTATRDDAHAKIKGLEEEVQGLTKLKGEQEGIIQGLNKDLVWFKKQTEQYAGQVQELTLSRDQALAAVSKANKEYEILKADKYNQDKAIDLLNLELARCKGQAEVSAAQITELTATRDHAIHSVSGLQKELSGVTMERLNLTRSIEDLNRNIAALKSQSESEIRDLTAARDEANDKIVKVQKELETVITDKEAVETQLENISRDLARLRSQSELYIAQLQEVTLARDNAEAALVKARKEGEVLKGDKERLESNVTDLQRQLAHEKEQSESHMTQINTLSTAHDQLNQVVSRLHKEVEGLTGDKHTQATLIDDLTRDQAKSKAQAILYEAQLQELTTARDQATATVARLQGEVDTLTAAKTHLEDSVQNLELQLEVLKGEAAIAATETNNLKQAKRKLEESLTPLHAQIESLRKEKLDLLGENDRLTNSAQAAAEGVMDTLRADAAAARAAAAAEAAAAERARAEAARLREELAVAVRRADGAADAEGGLTKRLETSLNDLAESNRARDAAVNKLAEIQRDMDAVTASRIKQDSLIDQLHHEIARLNREAEIAAAHTQELTHSRDEADQAVGRVRKSLEVLTAEKVKQDRIIDDLRHQMAQMEDSSEQHAGQSPSKTSLRTPEKLEEELEAMLATNLQQQATIDDLNRNMGVLKKQVEQYTLNNNQLAAARDQLNLKALQLEKDIAAIAADKMKLEAAVEGIQRELATVRDQARETEGRLIDERTRLADIVNQLRTELARTRGTVPPPPQHRDLTPPFRDPTPGPPGPPGPSGPPGPAPGFYRSSTGPYPDWPPAAPASGARPEYVRSTRSASPYLLPPLPGQPGSGGGGGGGEYDGAAAGLQSAPTTPHMAPPPAHAFPAARPAAAAAAAAAEGPVDGAARPVGVGILVGRDGDSERAGAGVLVMDLVPGGPAAACGRIQPSDELLSVDSVAVTSLPFDHISRILCGPEGTPVTLEFRRGGPAQANRTFTVTLIRRTPAPPRR